MNFAVDTSVHRPLCGEHAKWTAAGLTALCFGDASVIPPDDVESWNDIQQWQFAYLDETEECLKKVSTVCFGSFGAALTRMEAIDEILTSCPDALPYGSPCVGLDRASAQTCFAERLNTIANAMLK